MIPTFRPDGAHRLLGDAIAWNAWVDRLETATDTTIGDLASLLEALGRSYRRFARMGARASDHGLESSARPCAQPCRSPTPRFARHEPATRRRRTSATR